MTNNKNNNPRVLFLDIETSPLTGYAWGMYDTNIIKVLEPSKIICAAWQWQGEDKIICKALPDYPGYKAGKLDDSKIVKELWNILDEADVVIAHNGQAFDIKKINARFIAHNLSAPSTYKVVDTLLVSRKHFKFDNNSLDQLGQYLEEGQKAPTGGFALWDNCMKGDRTSWTKMKVYNSQDILLLKNVYMRLRPFITDHPNLNVISKAKGGTVFDGACPTCQSQNVVKRGSSVTRQGIRQRFQCNDCGAWSSGAIKYVKDVDLL